METPTGFDLNTAIQKWRDHLAQAPALHGESLDELEGHLRDSTARLVAQGLAPDEAFLIAQRRLGTSDELVQEFNKSNGASMWLARIAWMLVGFQAVGLISQLASLASELAYIGTFMVSKNALVTGSVAFVVHWSTVALLVWLAVILFGEIQSRLPALVSKISRHPVLSVMAILLPTFVISVASRAALMGVIRSAGSAYDSKLLLARMTFSSASYFFQVILLAVACVYFARRYLRTAKRATTT